MHPNPIFRDTGAEQALDFASQVGFGMLVVPDTGLLASHIPFVLDKQAGQLDLHLVRSNPIARHLRAVDAHATAMLAIQGPHAYISPDWYGVDDQVPTWNYVAVHLRGRLVALPDTALRTSLDRLSAHLENQLHQGTGKPIWSMDKMTPDALSGMMKAIRPFRFDIDGVDSTFKLGQNKSETALKGAVEGLNTSPIGSDVKVLGHLMASAKGNRI